MIEPMEPIYHARQCCDEYNYHIISTLVDARLVVFQHIHIDGMKTQINIFEEKLDIEDLLKPNQMNHLKGGFERVY